MSMFDKLKAYSRKPAAVILATVMATSTIPTTPIAQAVTAAYAAESATQGQTKDTKKAETKSVTPADLGINDIDNWNGGDQTVTYSVHIDKGTPNVTIKAETIAKLIDEQVRAQAGDQFKYDPNAQTGVSKVVNDELAGIKLPDGCKDKAVSKDKNGEYLVTTSLDTKSLAYTVSPAAGVTQNKDNSVTVVGNADGEVQLTFTVTKLNYNVSFNYGYEKPQEKKDPEPGKGDTSKKDENADTSNGAKGASGEETTTPATPAIPTTPEQSYDHVDVEKPVNCKTQFAPDYSKVVFQTPGKLTFKEYYSNLDPSAFAEVDATDLYYKTTHAPYVISLGYKGLRGEIKNSNKEFDAELTGDDKQNLEIKPNKHFDGGDFTINWYYPNDQLVKDATTTVHVKIEKRTIDLGHVTPSPVDDLAVTADTLPFRMANDKQQSAALKKSLNEAVAKLVKNYQMDNPEFEADDISDFFDSAEILNDKDTNDLYYGSAEQQNFKLGSGNLKLTPRKVKSDDDVLSNYTFVGSPIIEVKKMDSAVWSDTSGDRSLASKLTISGKGLNNEEFHFNEPDARWIHEKGTYTWKDGTIALANDPISSDTKFAASYQDADKLETMSEGSVDRRFYVKDSDGVIHKITNTTYKLDHTAPVLTAFNASPHGSEKTIKQNKLSVWAAEQWTLISLRPKARKRAPLLA